MNNQIDQLIKDEKELDFDIPEEKITNSELKEKNSFYQIYKGEESLKEFERLQKEYGEGVSTGYADLNNYFKFLPTQLYLLSAPTHHGKTMFALNMCLYISMLKQKVLFISLEQGVYVASFIKKISGGIFPPTLDILDTSSFLSVNNLNRILSGLDKYDLICIDHIHFLKKSGRGATEDIDEIIHTLQNLAKEKKVPVLAIAHLRKLNSSKPPTLDDLRDSSSLAQVPSVVMMVYRQESEKGLSDEGILYIRKNRIQGKTGALRFKIAEDLKIVFDDIPF